MKVHWGLMVAAMVISIVVSCAMICVRSLTRSVPINYICLLIFTIAETYMVAAIAATYSKDVVMMAACTTAGITIAITAYAMFTKADFTILGPLFFVIGMAMFMFCIFSFFIRYDTARMIWATIGVILYGLFLIFDTQLILGGKRYQIDIDDYILGAFILYTDIIMIFLYLL